MVPIDTDRLVIDLFKEGNEKSLELIFIKYYASLCDYTANMVKDDSVAEEIVSDVFFHLWSKRTELIISTSLKAYLYACAKNSALNYLRKKKVKFTSIAKLTHTHESSAPGPYEQIKEQEQTDRLHQIIDRLPDRRRRIFLMNWMDGLKIPQIAVELNLSENTVKNQLQSAYRYLKTQLPYLFSFLVFSFSDTFLLFVNHLLTIR